MRASLLARGFDPRTEGRGPYVSTMCVSGRARPPETSPPPSWGLLRTRPSARYRAESIGHSTQLRRRWTTPPSELSCAAFAPKQQSQARAELNLSTSSRSSRSRNAVHVSERGDAASISGLVSPRVGLFYAVGMERAVILFDDYCGFCRWSLSRILAWDRHGRLRPVALQSPESDDFLKGMDEERKRASWHLVAPDGRTHSGGQAVAHLARLLPGGTPVALLAGAVPRTTERAYRWVARHRNRLGRALGERACAVDPSRRPSAST